MREKETEMNTVLAFANVVTAILAFGSMTAGLFHTSRIGGPPWMDGRACDYVTLAAIFWVVDLGLLDCRWLRHDPTLSAWHLLAVLVAAGYAVWLAWRTWVKRRAYQQACREQARAADSTTTVGRLEGKVADD